MGTTNDGGRYAAAMAAIEIRMPFGLTGSFAPCRAGGLVGNQRPHSSFIPAKSASSRRMNVAWTTSSSVAPAAFRIASTLRRHCRVCSSTVSPTTSPVAGSNGPWPETKTRPFALVAWL